MSGLGQVSWDELYPSGRVVFYEGSDPVGFAMEMADLGVLVAEWVLVPGAVWQNPVDWERMRSFYIPAGRVEEIYGSGRWVLGS